MSQTAATSINAVIPGFRYISAVIGVGVRASDPGTPQTVAARRGPSCAVPSDRLTAVSGIDDACLHWSLLDHACNAVLRTGRGARVDSYEKAEGTVAAPARELGLRSRVGAPIVVDEHVWGSGHRRLVGIRALAAGQ
jgi:GAF domain-containing protein